MDANGQPAADANPLFVTKDGSATFTASNIKIADDWMNGAYGLTNTKDPSQPSTANDNILAMITALTADQSFEFDGVNFYNGSFGGCFDNIENTLAIDTKSTSTLLENQISVLNQTANSRDSVSGVQLDEEGMNLMHYNQSYTAAARLMTTLDEALDTLINNTGVVGR